MLATVNLRVTLAVIVATATLLNATAASAQQWTVTPNNIDFGSIFTTAADRTFVLRVSAVGGAPRAQTPPRQFGLTIRATPPVSVSPSTVQIGVGESLEFRVTARRDRVGEWSSVVTVNIGKEEMARLQVRGEFAQRSRAK